MPTDNIDLDELIEQYRLFSAAATRTVNLAADLQKTTPPKGHPFLVDMYIGILLRDTASSLTTAAIQQLPVLMAPGADPVADPVVKNTVSLVQQFMDGTRNNSLFFIEQVAEITSLDEVTRQKAREAIAAWQQTSFAPLKDSIDDEVWAEGDLVVEPLMIAPALKETPADQANKGLLDETAIFAQCVLWTQAAQADTEAYRYLNGATTALCDHLAEIRKLPELKLAALVATTPHIDSGFAETVSKLNAVSMGLCTAVAQFALEHFPLEGRLLATGQDILKQMGLPAPAGSPHKSVAPFKGKTPT